MPTASSNPYLTVAAVARATGLSEARVRQLADLGEIPAIRASNGTRLFLPQDVVKFRKKREAAHAAGARP